MKVVRFRVREGLYNFPGFTFQVKFASKKELRDAGTCEHCGKLQVDPSPGEAEWDYDTQTSFALIKIWKGASSRRKRYLFYHEWEHLWADLRHIVFDYHQDIVGTILLLIWLNG